MQRPQGRDLLFYVVLLVLYLLNSLSGEFSDEWDNIVGGKLIARGILPYTGFASQHFPLPYFLSAAMHLITGTNFVLFRLLFALLMYLWALFLYRSFRSPENEALLKYLFILLALVSAFTSLRMFLADTIIGYAVLSVSLVLFYRSDAPRTRDLALLSVCGFLIFGSSLGYIFAAAVTYLVLTLLVFRIRRTVPLARLIVLSLLTCAPYVAFLCYLLLTDSLRDFYWQNFVFNRVYYFRFFGEFPDKSYLIPFFVVRKFAQAYWHVVVNFSPKNVFYLTLLFFDAALLLFMLKERNYRIFFFTLLLLLTASTRFNVQLDVFNHNNTPLYPLSLFSLAFLSHKIFRTAADEYAEFRKDLPALAGALLAALFFMFVLSESLGSYYAAVGKGRIRNGDVYAEIINTVLRKDEAYWVGPVNIREMYFAERNIATRHLGYCPWQAASPEVNAELFGDLERSRPPLIIFHKDAAIWNHKATDYAQDLLAYLSRNYVAVQVLKGDVSFNDIYVRTAMIRDMMSRQKSAVLYNIDLGLTPVRHIEDGIRHAAQFRQTFVAPFDGLKGIRLLISTFKTQIKTPYVLTLMDGTCTGKISETRLDVMNIKDNRFFSATFPVLRDSAAKKYCFTLTPLADPVETPLTLHFSGPDQYTAGEAFVAGERKDEDIVFSLLY